MSGGRGALISAAGRHGVVDRRVDRTQLPCGSPARATMRRPGIVEPRRAFLDQDHRGNSASPAWSSTRSGKSVSRCIGAPPNELRRWHRNESRLGGSPASPGRACCHYRHRRPSRRACGASGMGTDAPEVCGCRHSFLLKLNRAMAGRRMERALRRHHQVGFYNCALTKGAVLIGRDRNRRRCA